MEITITIKTDFSDPKKNVLLNEQGDNEEKLKNGIMKLVERYGIPKECYIDRMERKVNKEHARINFRTTELMIKVFIALMDQAAADGDESYEKMASWIENIPHCSGMPLSEQEKACFKFACIRSVPGEIEEEDTPDE